MRELAIIAIVLAVVSACIWLVYRIQMWSETQRKIDEEAEQQEQDRSFREWFHLPLPKTDLERRRIQAKVEMRLAQIHSQDDFDEAREVAKKAGLYTYEERTDYFQFAPGPFNAKEPSVRYRI